jgi:pteridine reductase
VECEVFACDLVDPAVPQALVEAVRLRFPRCRLLVNNASVFERGAFEETGRERFDRVWAINFSAPFFLTQAFVSVFPRGHVVNLCDAKVEREFTSHFAYALSKKSVLAFTRMAAKALGPRFRVNAVAPGLILPSSEFDEAALSRLSRRLPLMRKGEASDVASAVVFLDENPYLTGECIFVDGGEHLH